MIFKLLGLFAALIAGVAMPAAAADKDVAKWGQVGGWQIMVDRTLADGCFAFQVFERGTVLRIGFDAAKKRIYWIIGHDDWKSLEVGKIYPVRVVFDGGKGYNGEMEGRQIGDSKTIYLAHLDISADFVKDFMQRNSLDLYYRGERIASLSLQNTYAAVGEILNCQKEMAATGRSQDPFASTPVQRGRDPFR